MGKRARVNHDMGRARENLNMGQEQENNKGEQNIKTKWAEYQER